VGHEKKSLVGKIWSIFEARGTAMKKKKGMRKKKKGKDEMGSAASPSRREGQGNQ